MKVSLRLLIFMLEPLSLSLFVRLFICTHSFIYFLFVYLNEVVIRLRIFMNAKSISESI